MSDLFEIRNSAIAGRGAFATEPIPAGTRLIEYAGERVSHEVADARYDDAEADGSSHIVLFTVDSRTVIDAGVGGNDARFINHSCAPNCQAVIVRRRVFIDAIRDIAPGEELAYDYEIPREGEDDETARKFWPCHCGAPTCRGTLLLPMVDPHPERVVKRKRKKAARKASKPPSGSRGRKATRRKPARTRGTVRKGRATARKTPSRKTVARKTVARKTAARKTTA